MSWSVFLLDETLPIPARAIGTLVQRVVGGIVYDHTQKLKLQYGWIARGLDESKADELLELLADNGLPAFKKPEERLVNLKEKLAIHKALLLEDAFYIPIDLVGNLKPIPWTTLSVVSVGSVPTFRQKPVLAKKKRGGLNVGLFVVTGIPVPKVKKVSKTVYHRITEEGVLIHLIFTQAGFVVEIRPRHFNYEYLGDRLAQTSRENFVLFLQDLQRLAAGAYWSEISRTFIETGELKPDFKSDKDFLCFNQWITEKTMR